MGYRLTGNTGYTSNQEDASYKCVIYGTKKAVCEFGGGFNNSLGFEQATNPALYRSRHNQKQVLRDQLVLIYTERWKMKAVVW